MSSHGVASQIIVVGCYRRRVFPPWRWIGVEKAAPNYLTRTTMRIVLILYSGLIGRQVIDSIIKTTKRREIIKQPLRLRLLTKPSLSNIMTEISPECKVCPLIQWTQSLLHAQKRREIKGEKEIN
jgi:hypothetical protein